MKNQISQVAEFMRSMDQPISTSPKIDQKRLYKRHHWLLEEEEELLHALSKNNLVEAADAIGDILYIVLGTALEMGIADKLEEIFSEIHRSNMSKLGPDGKPLYRESDGKVMKGPNYSPPNLKAILYGTPD